MRFLFALLLTTGLLAGSTLTSDRALAQAQLGPEGTPQVEAASETLRYTEGATPQLLTHYWIVLAEVDAFPHEPTLDQAKATEMRKRILDLRLIMDFNAFAFEPGAFEAYRDALDEAYEQVGRYKDLLEIQTLDGAPISAAEQVERLAKMNVALAPLRLGSFREDLKVFFYQRTADPVSLEPKNQPRLWQLAGVTPSDSYDSVGNAALLGQQVLRTLQSQGLLIGDIFDPDQEARFHDIRKAMRSVEVLADMFPSLAEATAEVREPLDKLIKAYGKTNDQIVAYQEALQSSRGVDQRAAELSTAFTRSQVLARELVESGQLEAFAARLEAVQNAHQR